MQMLSILRYVTTVAILTASGPAFAEFKIELLRPATVFEEKSGGYWNINIYGEIPPDAGERFARFMRESGAPDRVDVHLDSPGGSVVGGISLGRELRSRLMTTNIGRISATPDGGREFSTGQCLSACTLAYIGGHLRWIHRNDVFGVHRFYFQDPSPQDADFAQVLSAKIASFLREMGIAAEFMEISASTAGTDIMVVPHNLLRQLGVVNGGSDLIDWTMQSAEGLVYARGERYSTYGHQKLLLVCDTGPRRLSLHAIFEGMGRDNELMSMPQVDVQKNLRGWLDVSGRHTPRTVINGYFNLIIPLSTGEAREIAAAESVGVLIRFTKEAPMFLGIGGLNIQGGRQLIRGLLDLCGR